MRMKLAADRVLVGAASLALAMPMGASSQEAAPPGPPALIPDARPVRSCESLATVALPNTTIESAQLDSEGICQVSAIATRPVSDHGVRIWVAIPTSGWNGRFLGTGGGGFSGGSPRALAQPAGQGYAVGSTDTGHEGGSGSFALDSDSRLAWQRIRDNAHVGIHEMTVAGKALTSALYGQPPRLSYFNGCSTGGRQGLMEIQRYPGDYDGVLSGAPAINWHKLHVQQLWGPMLMHWARNPIPECKLAAATAGAIAACDGIDGVADGVIEDPRQCDYDASALLGTSAGSCGVFTDADVEIINELWAGPRREDGGFLWHGMPRDANLQPLSGSAGEPLRPRVMGITLDWLRYFLAQDPQFDWTTVSRVGFERLWDQSVEQYGVVIGTDQADLTEFRDRGGKAILWHGWSDPLITAEGTIDYYERVVEEMGGEEATGEFIRLFMAPGVGHCRGGQGPAPSLPMGALIEWVEEGRVPQTLAATLRDEDGAVVRTRPLCPYPLVARYAGSGSTDAASSFVCSDGF